MTWRQFAGNSGKPEWPAESLREEQLRFRETAGFKGFLAALGTTPLYCKGRAVNTQKRKGLPLLAEGEIHEGARKYLNAPAQWSSTSNESWNCSI
jgi:hypothetical protein